MRYIFTHDIFANFHNFGNSHLDGILRIPWELLKSLEIPWDRLLSHVDYDDNFDDVDNVDTVDNDLWHFWVNMKQYQIISDKILKTLTT